MPKSWWERVSEEQLRRFHEESERLAGQLRKQKYKGTYVLEGKTGEILQFIFYEQPDGRIRYEAFLSEEYLGEGFIDGEEKLDKIARKAYEDMQKMERLYKGYMRLREGW